MLKVISIRQKMNLILGYKNKTILTCNFILNSDCETSVHPAQSQQQNNSAGRTKRQWVQVLSTTEHPTQQNVPQSKKAINNIQHHMAREISLHSCD
jgi:hypothetical protein